MGCLTIETRTRIIHLLNARFTVQKIVDRLAEEDVSISRAEVYFLWKKVKNHGYIADLRRTPQLRIFQEEHYHFIDDTMAENMDLTARQLFMEKFPSVNVSLN